LGQEEERKKGEKDGGEEKRKEREIARERYSRT
jgi:hypothetical protein